MSSVTTATSGNKLQQEVQQSHAAARGPGIAAAPLVASTQAGSWHCLPQVDFAIVVVSVLVIALEALLSSAAAIQGLRALRAIKPLRMLTRSAGMRMVFKSIAMSLAAMGNVSIVLLMFFLIFAILGTQLFMGLLYR